MSYIVFDAHCDTLQKICDEGGSLKKNTYHLDLERLGANSIQVFAAFIDKKNDKLPPFRRACQLIDVYYSEMEKNPDKIKHCLCCEDIKKALNSQKSAALLSIEGGEAIEGDLKNLEYFYNLGVRIMTLCWNYKNEIADGIGEESGLGLSSFGKAVVSEMNDLGMLIDVSHISEKGFWDVIENSRAPIAATHSNAKGCMNHKRNLSDNQIEAIIKNDGFIGINFYSDFICNGKATITKLIEHIEYILALGGENNIGFGSDFDGIAAMPEGINGREDLHKIIDELIKLGYTDSFLKKLTSKNFLRILNKVIK